MDNRAYDYQLDIPVAPDWMVKRMNRPVPSSRPLPEQSVLEHLSSQCKVFSDNWEAQQGQGLDEDAWFKWISLLAHSSGVHHAREFSKASRKHGAHSEERLQSLEQSAPKGLVRCTTFGCSEEKISRCFAGNVRTNDSGQITNSPGGHLRRNRLPPSTLGQSQPVNLEQIGLHVSAKSGKLSGINGNVFVRYLLNSKLDLLYSNDRYYQYEDGVWRYKDYNAIQRILRDILHSFVPDSWNPGLQSSYLSVLGVETPRVDKMDPDRTLVNLANGMLDLRTYKLRSHDKRYHSTIQVPIRYEPTADCPKFRKFLNEVFEGDAELILVIGEMLGYCLTAEVKAQKAFILYGKGSNGKSVLADILVSLIGSQNVSSVSLGELENPFARLDLVDKLLNLSTENEVGRAGFNTGYFKKIVGGDDIRVEIKGGASFIYKPFSKQVFAVNNFPYSKDKSHGYLRRLQIIPFNKVFKEEEKNVHLFDELKEELPGILNFALEGLKRLVSSGFAFTKSKASANILKEYMEELNPVETFVEEMIVKGLPTDRVKNKTIGDVFKLWCQENGHSSLMQYTQVRLLRMIREILRAKGIRMNQGNAGDGRYQTGIQIKRSPDSILKTNVTVGEIDDIENIAD